MTPTDFSRLSPGRTRLAEREWREAQLRPFWSDIAIDQDLVFDNPRALPISASSVRFVAMEVMAYGTEMGIKRSVEIAAVRIAVARLRVTGSEADGIRAGKDTIEAAVKRRASERANWLTAKWRTFRGNAWRWGMLLAWVAFIACVVQVGLMFERAA